MNRGAHVLGLIPLLLSQSPPVPFGLGGAVRNLFWAYYPWLLALLLWASAVIPMLCCSVRPREAAASWPEVEAKR